MNATTVHEINWNCDEDYLERERQRVRKNVFKLKHKLGFKSSDALIEWWIKQIKLQNYACGYCKTPIRLIQALIKAKVLNGRPTRGNGIRGERLELERIDSKTNEYSRQNCVLVCYYCNNDKSNVYSSAEYVEFLAPAKKKHFLHLFEKHLASKRGANKSKLT